MCIFLFAPDDDRNLPFDGSIHNVGKTPDEGMVADDNLATSKSNAFVLVSETITLD